MKKSKASSHQRKQVKGIRLESIDKHLKDKLKNKEFRRLYEIEHDKVASLQKIS